jgi:hypothetical protein
VLAVSAVCYADTPDLTEFLSGVAGQVRCANTGNDSLAVYADVDGNQAFDTLVVFTTLQGEAFAQGPVSSFGYGNYLYFFTGDRTQCAGSSGGLGRIGIRFVDMLAPNFNVNNPATWVYKTVPGVQLVVGSDPTNETGAQNPYRQVRGYTEINQGGSIVGTFTAFLFDASRPVQVCDFVGSQGLKEIQIRSDFAENDIRSLVIHSNSSSGGSDAGLRISDGSVSPIRIACEVPGPAGELNSPLRFFKGNTKYGIILTDIDSPSASRIRIQTSSGTKAWAKLP